MHVPVWKRLEEGEFVVSKIMTHMTESNYVLFYDRNSSISILATSQEQPVNLI